MASASKSAHASPTGALLAAQLSQIKPLAGAPAMASAVRLLQHARRQPRTGSRMQSAASSRTVCSGSEPTIWQELQLQWLGGQTHKLMSLNCHCEFAFNAFSINHQVCSRLLETSTAGLEMHHVESISEVII